MQRARHPAPLRLRSRKDLGIFETSIYVENGWPNVFFARHQSFYRVGCGSRSCRAVFFMGKWRFCWCRTRWTYFADHFQAARAYGGFAVGIKYMFLFSSAIVIVYLVFDSLCRGYTLRCLSLVRYVVISFLFYCEKVSYILREETASILRLFAARLSSMLAVLYARLWAVGVWCLLGISGAVICERASEPPHLYDAGCIFIR